MFAVSSMKDNLNIANQDVRQCILADVRLNVLDGTMPAAFSNGNGSNGNGHHAQTAPAAPPVEPPQQQPFIDPLPQVPAALKARRQWVRWKLETVKGRDTKVPYQV